MLAQPTAKKIAIEIGNRLLPYCERLNIAGGIRRGKLEVHDIELLAQPKKVPAGQQDIFTGIATKAVVNADFIKTVNSIGKVIKGKPDGRQMQIEVQNRYGGVKTIMLDLFMPQAHDYYRMYAIRTGNAEYSNKVIANAWVRKGWVGTDDGLRLEQECFANKGVDGKIKWRCIAKNPVLPPAWQSEEDFFEWLDLKYIAPKYRQV